MSKRRWSPRRAIDYEPWNPELVRELVSSWAGRTRGWFVALTDHVLAPDFAAALDEAGRYVFAPLPVVCPGGRVRLSGDGPSSWAVWMVVARPRERRFMSWGTLPGAYIVKPEKGMLPGGKQIELMRSIVRDYSRPGDVVCDPCGGRFTTALAAALEGRAGLSSESDHGTYQQGAERCATFPTSDGKQLGLLSHLNGEKSAR